MDFLLDSGTAISVIHHKALLDHINITDATTAVVSANGAPPDVTGRVMLTVTVHWVLLVLHKNLLLSATLPWTVCRVLAFSINTMLLLTMATVCHI